MKLLVLLALIAAVFLGWTELPALLAGGPEPLQDTPYVTVYGRDACGYTKQMLTGLSRSGVPYTYKIIDDPRVKKELHPRMEQAGLSTRRYGLPVVDVNAEMMLRPNPDVVAKKYAQARPSQRSREHSTPASASDSGQSSDPIVACRINGHETFTLRSQCPSY